MSIDDGERAKLEKLENKIYPDHKSIFEEIGLDIEILSISDFVDYCNDTGSLENYWIGYANIEK